MKRRVFLCQPANENSQRGQGLTDHQRRVLRAGPAYSPRRMGLSKERSSSISRTGNQDGVWEKWVRVDVQGGSVGEEMHKSCLWCGQPLHFSHFTPVGLWLWGEASSAHEDTQTVAPAAKTVLSIPFPQVRAHR